MFSSNCVVKGGGWGGGRGNGGGYKFTEQFGSEVFILLVTYTSLFHPRFMY